MQIITTKKLSKKQARWTYTAAVDDEGKVFVPSELAGVSRDNVFMCAAFDGTEYIRDSGVLYLPVDWMRAEFPSSKQYCDKIESAVKEFLSKNPAA